MSTINIFFSWQSDLPNNTNRNMISNAISMVVKSLKDTIDIQSDRDTQNVTGSPNIEETIFKKINDSDIFVADVSIVGAYVDSNGRTKYTPNPNVLIELGYAAQVLGWDRVVCILNQDYGSVDKLPFDLAHHRVYSYSLNDKEKSEIKGEIRDIISSMAMDIMENGQRSKKGFASYVVGGYDKLTKSVVSELIPRDIEKSEFASKYMLNLKQQLKILIDQVKDIEIGESTNLDKIDTETGLIDKKQQDKTEVTIDLFKRKKYEMKSEDVEYIRNSAKKHLDIELPDTFFDVGNLEIAMSYIPMIGNEFFGTDSEKHKHDLLDEISAVMARIEIFELYMKCFDGIYLFNLAIWNNSIVTDKDLTVSVIIDSDTAEVIECENTLCNDTAYELAGFIYEEGVIESLFSLVCDSDILDGSDYEPPEMNQVIRNYNLAAFVDPLGFSKEPQYSFDDYLMEMKKYIASPISSSNNEYIFHISSIRPNERNWIGKGIMLKPKTDRIAISYKITSESTDGNISGKLFYNID